MSFHPVLGERFSSEINPPHHIGDTESQNDKIKNEKSGRSSADLALQNARARFINFEPILISCV